MLRTLLSHGLVAGLIVGVFLFTTTALGQGHAVPAGLGMALGYLSMLVALSLVFLAIKRRRDLALGGQIGFWPALGLGLGVSLVASLVYALAWEATLAVLHLDYGAHFAEQMVQRQREQGVSGAQLQQAIAEAERFRQAYANPLLRFGMTLTEILPVGVLVSLISAALLRNPQRWPARHG